METGSDDRTRCARRLPVGRSLPWLMWGLGALSYVCALFHRMSLSAAGLDAQRRFEIDATGLATFAAVQLLLYAALQVPVGLAADRLGPKRLLCAGAGLMAAGSITFALATSYPAGMVGRGLIGAGDALIFVNVLRLAHNWFPGRRYAFVAALTGMLGGLGQLTATAPLAALLSGAGWSAAFGLAGLLTAGVMVLIGVALRETPGSAGAAPIGTPSAGLPPARSAEPFRVLLRYVWHNRGTKHAMWAHFTLMGAFVSFTAVLGQPYLVGAHGLRPHDAGVLLAVAVAGFVVASTTAGQLAARRPWLRERLVFGCSMLSTLCWTVLVGVPTAAPVALLASVLLVLGACGGVSMLAFDLARSANHRHRAGAAAGVTNIGGFGCAVIAQFGAGVSLDALLGGGAAQPLAYRLSFLLMLVLSVLGTTRLFRLREHAGRLPWQHAAPQPVPVA